MVLWGIVNIERELQQKGQRFRNYDATFYISAPQLPKIVSLLLMPLLQSPSAVD